MTVTTRHTRRLLLAAAALALACGAVIAATPTIAQASPTSYFQLNTLRVDFDHWILLPPPAQPVDAAVDWQKVGNTVDPYLFGKVTVVDAQGFCGRVRMQALDTLGNVLDTYNSPARCPGNANPEYEFVSVDPFGPSSSIDSVKISAMLRLNGQTWQEQLSARVYAP
jgi:hypothetical protein